MKNTYPNIHATIRSLRIFSPFSFPFDMSIICMRLLYTYVCASCRASKLRASLVSRRNINCTRDARNWTLSGFNLLSVKRNKKRKDVEKLGCLRKRSFWMFFVRLVFLLDIALATQFGSCFKLWSSKCYRFLMLPLLKIIFFLNSNGVTMNSKVYNFIIHTIDI